MTKGQAILMLESVEVEKNVIVYRVTTNKGFLNFLKLEDAKTYAGNILSNGKRGVSHTSYVSTKKNSPGGHRPTVSPEESKARREFILKSATDGVSLRELINLARKSSDPVIRKVPQGSWSSIMHSMQVQKKIGCVGKVAPYGKLIYKAL